MAVYHIKSSGNIYGIIGESHHVLLTNISLQGSLLAGNVLNIFLPNALNCKVDRCNAIGTFSGSYIYIYFLIILVRWGSRHAVILQVQLLQNMRLNGAHQHIMIVIQYLL